MNRADMDMIKTHLSSTLSPGNRLCVVNDDATGAPTFLAAAPAAAAADPIDAPGPSIVVQQLSRDDLERNDIVLGRFPGAAGVLKMTNQPDENQLYQTILHHWRAVYEGAGHVEKRKIAAQIVQDMAAAGLRFLETAPGTSRHNGMTTKNKNKKVPLYYQVLPAGSRTLIDRTMRRLCKLINQRNEHLTADDRDRRKMKIKTARLAKKAQRAKQQQPPAAAAIVTSEDDNDEDEDSSSKAWSSYWGSSTTSHHKDHEYVVVAPAAASSSSSDRVMEAPKHVVPAAVSVFDPPVQFFPLPISSCSSVKNDRVVGAVTLPGPPVPLPSHDDRAVVLNQVVMPTMMMMMMMAEPADDIMEENLDLSNVFDDDDDDDDGEELPPLPPCPQQHGSAAAKPPSDNVFTGGAGAAIAAAVAIPAPPRVFHAAAGQRGPPGRTSSALYPFLQPDHHRSSGGGDHHHHHHLHRNNHHHHSRDHHLAAAAAAVAAGLELMSMVYEEEEEEEEAERAGPKQEEEEDGDEAILKQF
jgi:hypothetical protein